MREPIRFTIAIREIGNGFIVSIENRYEVVFEEKYCKNYPEILKLVNKWFTTSLDKLLKSSKD